MGNLSRRKMSQRSIDLVKWFSLYADFLQSSPGGHEITNWAYFRYIPTCTPHMARWRIFLEEKLAKDHPIRLSSSHSVPIFLQQSRGYKIKKDRRPDDTRLK